MVVFGRGEQMKAKSSGSATRQGAVTFAAAAALLSGSLANFLSYNQYPYLRPELGLLALGLIGVSASIGILYAALSRFGRPLIEGLLAAWFVDFNTDSIPLMIAIGVAVAGVGWWRQTSLTGPMAVLGAVVFVTTVLGLGSRPNWIEQETGSQAGSARATSRPALLHILLDEHLGLEGLATEGPDGKRLAGELRAAYQRAGFTAYGGAYSRYFDTVNAIPDVLNYGTRLGKAIRKGGVEVGPNAHFTALKEQGYRLTIFQSDYADYCTGTAFARCVTYDSSSLTPTLEVPMSPAERTQLIALKFLSLSDMFKGAAKGWNAAAKVLPLHPYDSDAKGSSTVGSIEAMNALAERMNEVRPGDAIFAHLLLPHYPYAVDRGCAYLAWTDWKNRHPRIPIEQRRLAYYEQVRCAMAKVLSLVDLFSRAAGPNSIVIIHGDHGSRITSTDPYENNLARLRPADLEAGYSTLFAVRAPGIARAFVPQRAPTSQLLRDFTASDFSAAPRPEPGQATVEIVARRSKKPTREVPLPAVDLEIRR